MKNAETLFEELKTRIIRCEISPGTLLNEGSLVDEFGSTRATVRQALKDLIAEGFIESVPRLGYSVTSPTYKDILDILEFRLLIEHWTVSQAAKCITQEEVEELRSMNFACDPDDKESFSRSLAANKTFHLRIAEIAGNRQIVSTLSQLLDGITRVLHMGLVSAATAGDFIDNHTELIKALEDRDSDKASQISDQQMRQSIEMIEAGIAKFIKTDAHLIGLA